MDIPLVISYDNNPNDETRIFMKTLETNGWEYKIIGIGETWKGLETRVEGYYKFLATLPDNQLVILSDARDVVCLRSNKAFLEGFNTFGKNMVVSMEVFCDSKVEVASNYVGGQCVPLKEYWKHYNIVKKPLRKFVNGGLLAGRVGEIRKWLSWTIDNKFLNDQLALGIYMNTFPDRIAADIDAILLHSSTFGVNAGIQEIHIQKNDSPTLAEVFGRGAFFLHIPGCTSKGQKKVYTTVCKLIDMDVCDKTMNLEYSFKEPTWNGYDGTI
jgi:hypothetical protein